MTLVHLLISRMADRNAGRIAIRYRDKALNYGELSQSVTATARALRALELERQDRVAVFLEKRFETISALFGAAAAGGVFVPVNPLLKPEQIGHILRDCNVRILITSTPRFEPLRDVLAQCPDLRHVVLVDPAPTPAFAHAPLIGWDDFLAGVGSTPTHPVIDQDMAAILYTSGSTGKPKGVVLSHRNLVAGAASVCQYLENTPEDRILSVLPLSFDYGLSQLTTAFTVGASVTLLNYLLPRDVINAVARGGITGLAAVPPLWIQLAELDWPAAAAQSLRYLTNSGGRMPRPTVDALRRKLPHTKVFLMYGLTEAFRSTYLPPDELDRRPDSIGKAIPNAEIMVVRPDGTPSAPNEPGELVHRGVHVALGYWNDPDKTAERFKPVPGHPAGIPVTEIAVWSGDTVRADEDGFLYFVGRRDEMIKTSGYRVSPTEVEEVIYATGLVGEVVVVGAPHAVIGECIVVIATPPSGKSWDADALLAACKRDLPAFMVPAAIHRRDALPRNANGKIDRAQLAKGYAVTAPGDKT